MKKFLAATFVTLALTAAGAVSAQAQHDVTVTIPEVVTIRFTDGTSRAPVTTNVDLAFLPTADEASTGGTFQATNVASRDWDDVQVFQNRETSWNVSFAVNNATAGFDWSQIAVTPGAAAPIAIGFDLGNPGVIAEHDFANAAARGWNRLGFGPGDFALTLLGTETAGTYTATVVYTLTAP